MTERHSVTIVEVAPRDGFQVVRPFIPTATKIAVIEALAACGFARMEIGSFVSPKAIPQLADVGEILANARLPNAMRRQVLVPNRKGLEAALSAGVREVGWVVSVSESHNRSNVRRSVEESLREFEAAWNDLGSQVGFLRFNLSTSFDCPFEGRTPEENVIRLVERVLARVRRLELAVADTTGRAAPNHVRALMGMLQARYASEDVTLCFHGHDTYGLGVANAIAAYEAGIRVIDGAAGGLGGCPFAPGASGNTATEDIVFAFEHMGVTTGIDLAKLLAAADLSAAVAPDQAGGRLRSVPRKRALSGFGPHAKGIAASMTA
jgi:hydroxymethylglutaryl-CoA lyase